MFYHKSLPRVRGIYCIINMVNGKFYIGSTVSYRDRIHGHRANSRAGKHNILFQRSYNKYGEEAFHAFLIEELPNATRYELRMREQVYLDVLQPWDPKIGLNMSKNALGADCPLNIQKYREKLGRRVVGYLLDGTFFKYFISVTEAIEECKTTSVRSCAEGYSQYAGNYMFRFVNSDGTYPEKLEPYKNKFEGVKRPSHIGPKIVATRKANGSYAHPLEDRAKFGKGRRGKKNSEESNLKRSLTMKGRKNSEEHIRKSSLGSMKPILASDWQGYPVNKFDSLKACAKFYGVTGSTISTLVGSGKEYKQVFLHYLPKGEKIKEIV